MTLYRIGSSLLRSQGGGGMFQTPTGGGGNFTPASGITTSGTFGDTQDFTFNSSALFGSKPNGEAPLFYWNPGQDGVTTLNALSRNASWTTNPSRGSIQSNVVVTGSTSSYEITSFTGGAGMLDGENTGTVDNLYIFCKWRQNWDGNDAFSGQGPDWNMKGWRWADSSFTHTIVQGFGEANQADGDPRYFYEVTEGGGAHYEGSGLIKNAWRTEEFQCYQGTINTSDANTKVFWNGKQEVNYTGVARTTANPVKYSVIYYFQYERLNNPGTYRQYHDIVYIDDSWCRVVLTDQSSWDTSVTRSIEAQPIINWGTNSIKVRVRKGAFSVGATVYAFAVKSDGVTAVPLGTGVL